MCWVFVLHLRQAGVVDHCVDECVVFEPKERSILDLLVAALSLCGDSEATGVLFSAIRRIERF